MAKSEKASKKIVKQPDVKKPNAKERKKPKYKSFRIQKKIKHQGKPIASWWVLFKKSIALFKANKKQLLIFVSIYGILNLLFVRGFGSILSGDGLEDSISAILGEETSVVANGFADFGLLISGSASGSGEMSQVYQTILVIISLLAIIWLYRQQQAGNSVTMKMAFYRGMYPLVPFLLVLLVIGLQLIPALIGNFLFNAVIQGGLAVGSLEYVLWFLFFGSTLLLTLYMLSSSIIALFIVTLPEMTPMLALRQARELVRFRRFSVIRKSIAVLLIFLVLLIVIVLPVIFVAPVVAEWLFFLLTILAVPFVIGYMFCLYRELL
jgi:hypothetical protein